MKRHKRIILAMLLLAAMTATGCWDKIEIEDRLFVLGMGVDIALEEEKGHPDDIIDVSFVSPLPSLVKDSGGEPAFKAYSTVDTTVAVSIAQLMERFGDQQFFDHTRVIVFGKELLKNEKIMKMVVDDIGRSHELHKSMYCYMAEDRAEQVFDVKPKFNALLAPYITGISDNSLYSTRIGRRSLGEFLADLLNKEGDAMIPVIHSYKDEVKITGYGIVKGHKLIGTIGEDETSAYHWLLGYADGGFLTADFDGIPVAFRHFTFEKRIKLNRIQEGKIYLDFEMETEGGIEQFQLEKKLMETKILLDIEKAFQQEITARSMRLVERFQKEFKVDLLGVEDYLAKYHPSIYRQIEKDYNEIFTKDIVINIKPEVKIRRIGTTR